MLQVRRNLTDVEAVHCAKQHLLIDRDSKYTARLRRLIRDSGTKVIRLAPRSPNLNAYAERFVRSIKDECLNRMIFVGQASLRRAVNDYLQHYHRERNHQGLENRLLQPMRGAKDQSTVINCHARLGGVLNYYHRMAA